MFAHQFSQLLYSFWPMELGSCSYHDHDILVSSDLYISQHSYQFLSIIWCGWLLHYTWNYSSHILEDIALSWFSFYPMDCSIIVLSEISSLFLSSWISVCSGRNIVNFYIYCVIDPVQSEWHNFILKITPLTPDYDTCMPKTELRISLCKWALFLSSPFFQ